MCSLGQGSLWWKDQPLQGKLINIVNEAIMNCLMTLQTVQKS